VNGKPEDAGLMSNCDGVCKMKNIPKAEAFAITLEKKGGSPTPNLASMFVMGKV
jgi:anti-sigma-K factor RskA